MALRTSPYFGVNRSPLIRTAIDPSPSSNSGLIYCHHRYYDPYAGRWITRDPIGLEGGENSYEYCSGDPIDYVDPSGLDDVYLMGDTDGIASLAWASSIYQAYLNPSSAFFRPNWLVDDLNWDKFYHIMTSERLTNMKAFGHGHGACMGLSANNGSVTVYMWNLIAKARISLHLPKLHSMVINCCDVMQDPAQINAMLEVADSVTGYIGLTVNQSGVPGIPYTFTRKTKLSAKQLRDLPLYLKLPDLSLKPGEGCGAYRPTRRIMYYDVALVGQFWHGALSRT